jgi:hypothetical protein
MSGVFGLAARRGQRPREGIRVDGLLVDPRGFLCRCPLPKGHDGHVSYPCS